MIRQILRGTILVAGAALLASPVFAQEIVAAAPSNQYAVAAGDMAISAVAQLNDAAEAAKTREKVELYKQLMELNGVSRNVRQVISATKTATRLVIIDRAGTNTLSAADDARYNTIADGILLETQDALIENIAASQAPAYSTEEIQQLITANSSIAAAKYNAGKFMQQDESAAQVQSYMVEAVIRIIKTFTETQAS